MNLRRIASIHAVELLDSRGFPTMEVTVTLCSGIKGTAMVPSGRSTGKYEAVELRDADESRYRGTGVLNAIRHVNETIADRMAGMEADNQCAIDRALNLLDGTEFKSRLGANAILGVSVACARAAAAAHELPLYRYLGGCDANILPVPMFNVLNGGKHAWNGPDMQEFKLVPAGAPTLREAIRYGAETYHMLGEILRSSGAGSNVGDEGGYAPVLPSNKAAMQLLMQAIERAGYVPGQDIFIGLDPAATSFYSDGRYRLSHDSLDLTTAEMIDYWDEWTQEFPIISLEDPLADTDWKGFAAITARLGEALQIVGDDLFVTNRNFLTRGIQEHCCNSILIKPNQIGSLTETFETARTARGAAYSCLVSHRSGETEDTLIADLAVALNTGQIKSGAPARGERIAKYNRLMKIEDELGDGAVFAGLSAFPLARPATNSERGAHR